MSEVVTQDDLVILTKEIRKIIWNLYKALFKGKLEVHKTDSGYTLVIGIPSNDRPSFIDVQGTKEDFLKYIQKDFKYNKRIWIDFKQVNLIKDD